MSAVTRRGALSLIPAAVASVAAPAALAAPAAGVTPALAAILAELDAVDQSYWQEYRDFRAFYDASRREDGTHAEADTEKLRILEESLNGLQGRCYAPFDKMLDVPCHTLADVRAKLRRMIGSAAGTSDHVFSAEEIQALFVSILGEAA